MRAIVNVVLAVATSALSVAKAEEDQAEKLERQHKQRLESRTRDEVRRWSDLLMPMIQQTGGATTTKVKTNPGENPKDAAMLPAMNSVPSAPTIAPVNLGDNVTPSRVPAAVKPSTPPRSSVPKEKPVEAALKPSSLLTEPPHKLRLGFLYVDKVKNRFLSLANAREASRFEESSREDPCLQKAFDSIQKVYRESGQVKDMADALVTALEKAGEKDVREKGVRVGPRLWVEPNGELSLSLMRDPEETKSRELYTYSNGLRLGVVRKPEAKVEAAKECEIREDQIKTLMGRLLAQAERAPSADSASGTNGRSDSVRSH